MRLYLHRVRTLPYLVQVALLTGVYIAVAKFCLLLSSNPDWVTPVWPLSGLVLAVLLHFGLRLWPGVFIGDILVAWSIHIPVEVGWGIAAGTTAEAVICAGLLRQLADDPPSLDNLREMIGLIVIAAFIAIPSGATISTASYLLGGLIAEQEVARVWMTWWTGDVMGVLVVTPLLIVWANSVWRLPTAQRVLEGLVLFGSLAIATRLIFAAYTNYSYLLFPLIIWAALRFGQRGNTLAIAVVSVITIWTTALGDGPFALATMNASLIFLQTFLGVLTTAGLILSVLIAERQYNEEALLLIADLSRIMARAGDVERMLQSIAERLVGSLGDWCIIDVLGMDGRMRRLAVASSDQRRQHLAGELYHYPTDLGALHRSCLGDALHTRQIQRCNDMTEQLAAESHSPPHARLLGQLRLRGAMAIPLLARGRTIGGIVVYNSVSGRRYRLSDVALARDISQRIAQSVDMVRLESQLIQAQKLDAIGRLAGGIAHDFNNLLMVIRSSADLIAEAIDDDPEVREDVDQIIQTTDRARGLTRQLLVFARREALELRPTSIAEIIRGGMALLRRLIGHNINVVADVPASLPMASVDRGQFEQVLLNLAINGRDAMPDGGTLTITASAISLDEHDALQLLDLEPGDYVMVTVSDTGIGMDDAIRGRIFEPFFTTKANDKGTGLGLAICYSIIRQCNGHITVASEPGHGTTFTIYLPVAAARSPAPGPNVALPA
jgi:signal transduction histidine kinase/integral membrane sensor domain MASE1